MFLLPIAWFVGGLAGSAMNITAIAVPSGAILPGPRRLVAADLACRQLRLRALRRARACPRIPERRCAAGRGGHARADRDHDDAVCHGHTGFGIRRLARKGLDEDHRQGGGELDRGHGDANVRLGDAMNNMRSLQRSERALLGGGGSGSVGDKGYSIQHDHRRRRISHGHSRAHSRETGKAERMIVEPKRGMTE